MPGTRTIRAEFLGPGRDPDDYEQVTDIVDVWFDQRLDPQPSCWRSGADLAMAGLALSRRLRPASRLVPFLAARSLRHARPRALRRGADARLRARRAGPQDVEVLGQRRRAAGSRVAKRRRHPAPLGRRLGLLRGSAHRAGDPEVPGRCLSPAAQHAALSPGRARGLQPKPSASRRGRCPSSSATCCIASPRLDALVRQTAEAYDFHTMFTALHNFCAVDLSAFYFDVRKDALYCDAPDAARRRARAPCSIVSSMPRALAGAGALLHRRGGLARPPRRWRGNERPSRALSRAARRLARRRRSARNGRRSASCAASSPAPSSWSARKSASARAFRRRSRFSPRPSCAAALAGLDLAEICITSAASLRARRRRRRTPSRSPDVPGVGVAVDAGAGREMPALLARPARGRRACRRTPICAAAAPRRSRASRRAGRLSDVARASPSRSSSRSPISSSKAGCSASSPRSRRRAGRRCWRRSSISC